MDGMTREEAILELEYIRAVESTDKGKEALAMAIKALELQPNTHAKRYLQKLLKEIENEKSNKG